MKNITKTFVQTYVADMEGRHSKWYDTDKTYEDAVKTLNNWTDAVRVVEKTFDPETFTITERELKRTDKVYEHWRWNGAVKETIF